MTPSKLHAIRLRLSLTATTFAALVRVDRRTVHRWEAGERDIPGTVQVLAEALRDSPEVRRHFNLTWKDPHCDAG